MRIFFIPSWFPSAEQPIYGTFVQEQIDLLARLNPNWTLGVSLWGQGRKSKMIWVRKPLDGLIKCIRHPSDASYEYHKGNTHHYYHPALTWTRKIRKGNLRSIHRSVADSYQSFEQAYGRADVIHAQASYPAALAAARLSANTGIPYVVSIRMSPFPFDEFLTKDQLLPWISEPLRRANRLIATSNSLKDRLGDFDLEKVSVLHNPVDTEIFKPGNQPDSHTILTAGRMVPQKGIDLLIEAIAVLSPPEPWRFRIIGDGPEKEAYESLARQKGITDRIDWLGEQDRHQVAEEMRRCSFYVLPSRHETFGNVLLEALASGKPVLATQCGGPKDIVSQQTGLLVANNSVNALKVGLEKMMESYASYDPEVLIDEIQRRFSANVFSDGLKEIYSSVLNQS